MHIGAQPISSAAIVTALAARSAVFPDGTEGAPAMAFASEPGLGWRRFGSGQLAYVNNGSARINFATNAVIMAAAHTLGWSAGANPSSADLWVTRDAANTLAQRNGVTAQMFRVYNTFTDASNYERLNIGYSGNVAQIYGQFSGTGSNRALQLSSDGGQSVFAIEGSSANLGYLTSFAMWRNGTSAATILGVGSSGLTSTGILFARLTPSINQASGTYTVLDINPTETAIGPGPHYLLRGRIGAGADVFNVDRAGNLAATSLSATANLVLGSSIRFSEIADPGAPIANTGLLYMRDNGSGKTQLVARFPTGIVQVIATEP